MSKDTVGETEEMEEMEAECESVRESGKEKGVQEEGVKKLIKKKREAGRRENKEMQC